MKSITGNNTKQSGGSEDLSSRQLQLLQHFNAMDDEAQYCVLGMMGSIAAGCAARAVTAARPKLRMVAGGAQ